MIKESSEYDKEMFEAYVEGVEAEEALLQTTLADHFEGIWRSNDSIYEEGAFDFFIEIIGRDVRVGKTNNVDGHYSTFTVESLKIEGDIYTLSLAHTNTIRKDIHTFSFDGDAMVTSLNEKALYLSTTPIYHSDTTLLDIEIEDIIEGSYSGDNGVLVFKSGYFFDYTNVKDGDEIKGYNYFLFDGMLHVMNKDYSTTFTPLDFDLSNGDKKLIYKGKSYTEDK